MKQRAVFIDRDGTISEEVGYINHPSRFHVFPYSAPAIKLLNESGWLAIVVTNQAGVARGYFSEEMIKSVHEQLKQDLENNGARLDAIYYCAHHPSAGEPPYRLDCDCRCARAQGYCPLQAAIGCRVAGARLTRLGPLRLEHPGTHGRRPRRQRRDDTSCQSNLWA